jgi:hypothetical protein
MTDSPEGDGDSNWPAESRIEQIERWAEYIRSEPPETWGPQQNALVNGQLEAARSAGVSAAHRQHVEAVAAEILALQEDAETTDERTE